MHDEQIQMLLENITEEQTSLPYIILMYFDGSEFDEEDNYFAAIGSEKKPKKDDLTDIYLTLKKSIGNIAYAADHIIMKREKAIDYLEELLD